MIVAFIIAPLSYRVMMLRTGLVAGPLLAHTFCNFMGLPDFGAALHSRAIGAAFVLGLGGFIVLVTLDAVYRPPLFGSMFWAESAASLRGES